MRQIAFDYIIIIYSKYKIEHEHSNDIENFTHRSMSNNSSLLDTNSRVSELQLQLHIE